MKKNKFIERIIELGNSRKLMFMKRLIGVIFALSIVSCGNASNRNKEVRLSPEQVASCENYFIACQVIEHSYFTENAMEDVFFLLETVRLNGYVDVIHAFSVPDNYSHEQREAYAESALRGLGIDPKRPVKSFGGSSMPNILVWVYGDQVNPKLKQPSIKAYFVKELDNGDQLLTVKDSESKTQIGLTLNKDGHLTVVNK